uniref:NADH-ubiquinone oxidoreductase chain 6 n=1 Tax=Sporolithon durum TaxID=48970 RepID=V9P5Q4_9FLOR|nr:NADH dehydrogenase subunit 6 [Sporolithon durum]AGU16682.1 NADH dehydrogenase subunit 6 [Sporolithon durum]
MNIDLILFYFFSSFALVSALMVVTLTNAVHSVLFLILVFCNITGLLLLLGVEFISFLLLIVYVGAIAVLFLFVVMMLNIKFQPVTTNKVSLITIGSILLLTLILHLFSMIDTSFIFASFKVNITSNLIWVSWLKENAALDNIKIIGSFLYTKFSLLFLLCSLILLVAMIGVIVLTMHQRTNVKKQIIDTQVLRNPKGALKFVILRKK